MSIAQQLRKAGVSVDFDWKAARKPQIQLELSDANGVNVAILLDDETSAPEWVNVKLRQSHRGIQTVRNSLIAGRFLGKFKGDYASLSHYASVKNRFLSGFRKNNTQLRDALCAARIQPHTSGSSQSHLTDPPPASNIHSHTTMP
jgi:histidyl-tRNA synthetase